jgi:hypothetical protein
MTTTLPAPGQEHEERPVRRRDSGYWSRRGTTIQVGEVPAGAVNLNVDGRRVVGPLQGFGRLWQRTYRVRLCGAATTPAEVVRLWKERFPEFLPAQSRFFPTMAGVRPGEVVLIHASITGMPVDTGVIVLYADDESFTLMTPQGHPESGWNTFSASSEDGCTVAQIQSIGRANDPIYELGFRLLGSRAQERIWRHVLIALAAHYGVDEPVQARKTLVDPRLQWSQARNVWHNAMIRSMLYTIASPLRRVRRPARR